MTFDPTPTEENQHLDDPQVMEGSSGSFDAVVDEAVFDYEAQVRQERETLRDILAGRVREHIYRKQPRFSLRQYLNDIHFADITDAIENEMTFNEGLACLDALAPTMSANIMTALDDEHQHDFMVALAPLKLNRIIRAMAADDAADMLQLLSEEEARKVLGKLPQDADTKLLRELLVEAPDTAAGIMSTGFIKLPMTATIGDALERIQDADENEFIYYLYLVDEEGKLAGVLSIKTVLLQRRSPERLLIDYSLGDVKSVIDDFDQELVANIFRKYYNFLAMPVVDEDQKLLGIITLDDVIDVIDEESQEDLYRTQGINLSEDVDERGLLTGSAIKAVKARIPWLAVTLIGQLCVASIIGFFTGTVSGAVKAFSFLPLLCGLSGNVGTQSDTISVRGIALDIISPETIRRQVLRELRVAAMIGGTFAVVLGAASYLMYRHALLSFILCVYVFFSNCLSASMGVLIPYTIKYIFKQDPAGVGGPFITTSMDLLMYTSYLSLLMWLGPRLI